MLIFSINYFNAVQIVDSEVGRALVFVGNKAETFGLTGLLVSDKEAVNNFTKLGEDNYDIAFSKFFI